ncbi:hypothetical protein A2783_04200 [Microgenomates group bacterium RIFCSPHIGHO2_01_FULL_45_11]|nr:MAG: hypothetical protein A2783_04200 [Microgenomates group bacterium RIFCSPHIGHO2_01_FULL_45_11]
MAQPHQLTEEIDELHSLKQLIASYEEIASIRMRRTRESVLKNREFLREISAVFDEVRSSYADQIARLSRRRFGKNKVTFLAHNGKKVAVLLSAQTGLYGEIVSRSFNQFAQEVREGKSEVTIVGRHGLNLFVSEFPNHLYTFFELPDFGVSAEQLNEVVHHVVQYDEIHAYYGEFVSVVTQQPKKLTITAEISLEGSLVGHKVSYVFEPSLEKILMFFETEIFASLFNHTVKESQLAKFASRVLALDQADEKMQNRLKKLQFEHTRAVHWDLNKKQLNLLPAILGVMRR